eukprot:8454678-Karenia_brevis.AAC.1
MVALSHAGQDSKQRQGKSAKSPTKMRCRNYLRQGDTLIRQTQRGKEIPNRDRKKESDRDTML